MSDSEKESSLAKWTYVECPSPLIFYADKPAKLIVAPKVRPRRFFPMNLRPNTFHRVNMRQRINSCTIEETSLQTSRQYICSESGSYNLLRSGKSFYSHEDSNSDNQNDGLLDCSLHSLVELNLNTVSDDLAPDPDLKLHI